MARRLFYTDHHILPLPAGHKFPIAKYRMLRDLLGGDRRFRFEAAPLASSEIIELIHDPTYVRAFMAGTLDTAAMRRIGFPWSEQLVRRTLASVGGTLAAAEEALQAGWGGTLAGGTHHAFAGEGSGFCVFNDIAVAIATSNLGKPAPDANGDITVDRSTFFSSLGVGDYVAAVAATGAGGTSVSTGVTFTR